LAGIKAFRWKLFQESLIMVSPKIVNDVEGGVFGYGYQPSSSQAQTFMGAAGY
jgi:type IV pilus assembly protein PilQ